MLRYRSRVDRIDLVELRHMGSLGKKGGADAARKTGSTRTAGARTRQAQVLECELSMLFEHKVAFKYETNSTVSVYFWKIPFKTCVCLKKPFFLFVQHSDFL